MATTSMLEVAVRPGDPSTLPELATRTQVATATGLSIPTLARWAGEGKGPKWIKLGAALRYRKADVLAWIDALAAGS